ncbi:MAG: TonB-dependent receptor [Sphingobium sp.]
MALATFVTATAHAADEASADAIVVVGKSLEETQPQELARYGSDLVTIDAAQIKNEGAVDLATALQSVPGLFIRNSSGPFSYVDLSLQGSRKQDVLWTWDGIRLNNRLYGTTLPTDTLPASMIERIEVLKGGESLFYGTQAAAGVINVVTRGFTDDFNGQVNAAVDSFGGNAVDGYARGAIGDQRFVVYASHNQSRGFQPYSRQEPSATDRKRGYDLWSAGLKYQYELATDLTLNAFWQHTEGKIDNSSPSLINQSRNDRNEEIAGVRLDYTRSEAVQFFLKGYFHDWKTAYVQIRNTVPATTPVTIYPAGTFWGYQDYGGTAVVKLRLHPYLEYLAGYDFQQFKGRDDVLLIAPTNERVHAGIFQVRTTDDLSEKGRLAAGLRYTSAKGSRKTIWNVSGRYDFSDALFLEANGGTSFILPDASSLYQIDPCCELGNPNLKPEESLNINASVGGKLGFGENSVRWKATYFNRRITNLITTDDTAVIDYNGTTYFGTFINVPDKVKASGIDLELNAILQGGWRLTGNYTLSHLRRQGSDLQIDRTPEQHARGTIAYVPEDKPFGANIAVDWTGDAWSTVGGAFGRRNYGNYALVDVGVHFYPDAARQHRLGINVENLLNEDYASRGYGRTVSDAGRIDGTNSQFLYYWRGTPRTLRVSYGVGF